MREEEIVAALKQNIARLRESFKKSDSSSGQARLSITSTQDAEYMRLAKEAVALKKSGQEVPADMMARLNELVNEAARANGYDVNYLVYHGSREKFNVFMHPWELDEDGAEETDPGNLGYGFYFTPNKSYAERFGKARPFLLNMRNVDVQSEEARKAIKEFYDENSDADREEVAEHLLRLFNADALSGRGVGGLSYGAMETMVRESGQAKLATIVTFDDDGRIIPLSQRFNRQNDDVRYSLSSPRTALQLPAGNLLANGQKAIVEILATATDADVAKRLGEWAYARAHAVMDAGLSSAGTGHPARGVSRAQNRLQALNSYNGWHVQSDALPTGMLSM